MTEEPNKANHSFLPHRHSRIVQTQEKIHQDQYQIAGQSVMKMPKAECKDMGLRSRERIQHLHI